MDHPDIEEVAFTAAEIEQALSEWYRRKHIAKDAGANIEIVGIMNRVYFRVEHLEAVKLDGRNQRRSGKAPTDHDR